MQQRPSEGLTVIDPDEYRLMRQLRSASAGPKISGPCKPNLTLIPDLPNSCENAEDGKSSTFFLRKDVQFHDGAEPTAAKAQTGASDVDCLRGDQLS
jgi:ABC-type transport system substrate-binding protein